MKGVKSKNKSQITKSFGSTVEFPAKIKNAFFVLFFGSLFVGCGSPKITNQDGTQSRPNIILFLVDDMGWQDTSVPFWIKETPLNKKYHTPNMERLANKGAKFTQAYASPICSPSRVSILTGANAARHRVTNWTLRKNHSQDAKDEQLKFPVWNMNGLQPVKGIENSFYATPLPKILNKHGYFTIHTGKAHFGAIGTPGANPLNIGFDVNIAGHAAGAPESYLGTENFGNSENGNPVWAVPGLEKYHGKEIFLTEALTREALSKIDSANGEKPFFLYMAHYAVHSPIMADKRFYQKYIDAGLGKIEAKYASMIEGMDKSLGDIMDYLEEKNIANNTIILFMSDNGGLSAVVRGGPPHTHNLPLNSGKGSSYEGGIRVPMMVYWPGITQRGSVIDQYVITEDFFPSILGMANIENPEIVQQIDGESFVPLLRNPGTIDKSRPLFWHFPNKWGAHGPGIGTFSSVRLGDFKLIYFHKDRSFELYSIKKDIGEKQNLAEEKPKKVGELATVLTNHLKAVNAQMPFDRRTNKKVEYPLEIIKHGLTSK